MLKVNGSTVYRLTPESTVKSYTQTVQLFLSEGHYYPRQVVVDGQWKTKKVITADGFQHLNAFAGVSFIRPKTMCDEHGNEVDNPIINREHGAISSVKIREIAVGRSGSGNRRAIDLTLSYNALDYLASDLFDTFVKCNEPDWGRLVNHAALESLLKENPSRGSVPIGGGNFLVYNMKAMLVRDILRSHASWASVADRTAATLVERNLLRRFFGFDCTDDDGFVEITTWVQSEESLDEIQHLPDTVETAEVEATSDEIIEATQDRTPESNPAELIRAEARRIGSIEEAKKATAAVCRKHKLRWGDIGSTDNQEALLEIYSVLSKIN